MQAAGASGSYYPFLEEPTSNWELLTHSGYDDYEALPLGAPSGAIDNTYVTSANFLTAYNASPDYAQQVAISEQTKGLATWSKIKVLGTSSTFLFTVSIYDERSRLIQIKSTNISGGTDVTTNQYDFSGKLIRSFMAHQKSGANSNLYLFLTKYSYDHAGRLLLVKKRVNNNSTNNTTDKTIVANTYDELGQLKSKKLAADYNGGAGLETLNYDYNIRGWLLGINREYAKSSSSTANYFGFDLGYEKSDVGSIGSYSAVAQYNGNIRGMAWKSTGDDEIRKYDFTYDNVNRLIGADFNQYTSSTFNKAAGLDFSVSNLSYDANRRSESNHGS